MMNDTDIFEAARPDLTALGYRMLGEKHGAEDIVQETWLKWQQADKSAISSPVAWLRRVASNIAIDALRSARSQREIYVGPWLPEPILQSDNLDAEHGFERAQECELALLWAMERLNETERAAVILREAFDASYAELAEVLNKSEQSCRQIVSRATRKLKEDGPRFDVSNEQVTDLSQRFFVAVMSEDYDAALSMMAPTAQAISDGGAKQRAARRPLVGGEEILQVLSALLDKAKRETGWVTRMGRANNRPAFLRYKNGVLDSVTTLLPDSSGKITWLYIMRNPDKLGQGSL